MGSGVVASQRFTVQCAGLTDRGVMRAQNQDALCIDRRHGLFVVADGMGGHSGGEFASRIVAETAADSIRRAEDPEATAPRPVDPGRDEDENRLLHCLHDANTRVREFAAEHPTYSDLGSTAVALLSAPGPRAIVAHIGDSRAYVLRGGELRRVTDDHTWVRERVMEGVLLPEEADMHPWRHVITRAIGHAEFPKVDVASHAVEAGDTWLLCSDGLAGVVPEAAIRDIIVGTPDLDEAVRALVQAACDAGGPDNVTALLVRFLAET